MALREQLKRKSDENWEAACLCRAGTKWNAAASRYYYSLYNSVRYWADKQNLVKCNDRSIRDVHETMANIVGTNAGANAQELRGVMNDSKSKLDCGAL